MHGTVAKEDTFGGMKSKFSRIIGSKIRPSHASKDSKRVVVWFFMKDKLNTDFVIYYLARKDVDEVCGCEERLVPIL
jgi:hypothetical protein